MIHSDTLRDTVTHSKGHSNTLRVVMCNISKSINFPIIFSIDIIPNLVIFIVLLMFCYSFQYNKQSFGVSVQVS